MSEGNIEDDGIAEWYSELKDRLPEKHKDPQAFVQSYAQLERRLTEEATSRRALEEEIEQLRLQQTFSDTEYTDEDFEAFAATEPFQPVLDESIAASEPALTAERIGRATGNLNVLALLSEAAKQAEVQFDQKVGQGLGAIPQAPTPDTTALAAVETMRATYPGWNRETERLISEEIETNPAVADMISRAVESNDQANISHSSYRGTRCRSDTEPSSRRGNPGVTAEHEDQFTNYDGSYGETSSRVSCPSRMADHPQRRDRFLW